MELKGKTAFVTGGAIRIGKSISTELANNGVNLAINYNRSDEAALSLKQELERTGVRVEIFQADISEINQLPCLFDRVNNTFGQVDILINNAGIFPKGKLIDLEKEKLYQVFNINLFAPLFLMQLFAKQLPDGSQGKIINIIDAEIFKRNPERFAYRLAKLGLWEATKLAALELAPNITVNAISPGIMMSIAGYEHMDMEAVANRRVPLKRLGSAEIVAQNVIHILTQDFMTGHNIVIDGGEYL